MRLRMSMMARRVGFVLTPSRRSSASGWAAAGDEPEGRAGRVGGHGLGDRGGQHRPVEAHGVGAVWPVVSSTAMPRARSIRSVWSRVAIDSVTAVSPSAARPASRTADLTWALGTGVS